ncbi:MAG: class I SAM-dependent methyltransferase [Candidatus Omnitrophica bacterium]|nr:class I SAM-dependent methyltransferase [Candidatus Omnitrophota bacterium]
MPLTVSGKSRIFPFRSLGWKIARECPVATLPHLLARWFSCPFERLEPYVPREGVIVDLGCGHGLMLRRLASLLPPETVLLGFDLDAKKIAFARHFDESQRVQYEVKDVASGPGLGHVSCLILNDVLHLLPFDAQERLLRRCFEDLAEGGVMILKEIDTRPSWKYAWAWVQEFAVNHLLALTRGRGLYYSAAPALTGRLEKIGFNVEALPVHQGYPYAHVIFLCRKG